MAKKKAKQDTRDKVVVEFADGVEQECYVEGIFTSMEQDYLALVPKDGDGDVYIYKYKEGKNNRFTIEDETDDEKFAAAVREFEIIVGHVHEEDEKNKKKKKGKKNGRK
jgi:hypothetical protein